MDSGQQEAVALLAGDHRLVLVEGAAGVGKTTVLAATREALREQGRGLVVVTPTLKAAQIAAEQVGSPASSVARLIHQHGWRWDDDGTWTRLRPGEADPATGSRAPGPGAGVPGCGRATCCWSTKQGCLTRTPRSPCSPSPTNTTPTSP